MVSVIIPIYNTENYLDECISSVVNQDYSDLEIILINDGSTDRSGNICRKWEALDPRIRYVEKENEGQGATRNLGIRLAAGEYIIFVDSDDYIERTLVSRVLDCITEEKADICVYANNGMGDKIYKNSLEFKLVKKGSVKENKELLGRLIPILCNKMFSAALFQNTGISMSNHMCEDLVFNAQLYMKAKGICFLDRPLYNYRYLREGNFSTNYERYFEVEESIRELNEIFQREGNFEEYWLQLYEISFNMFKDILFRIYVRKEYHVPSEIKNRYPDFFHSYKNFLSRWFYRYLTMEMQEKNFLLVGSYSLRVIIHALLLNEDFLREDYASSSLISLMSDPFTETETEETASLTVKRFSLGGVQFRNSYRKRCVEQDVRKHFQRKAKLDEADYVVVDLLDEIFDLIVLSEGCYITESAFLQEAGADGLEGCERISFVSAERRKLFQKYAPLFAEKVRQAQVPVIVVKNYLCEKHSGYYDQFTEYDSLDWIRETNRELEWYYGYLLQCLPEALWVDASEFRELEFTHDDFPFGREPVYYNSSYYQRMAVRVNQAIHERAESDMLEKLKSDIEEYDRIFLIREDEPLKEKLLEAFFASEAVRETKRKILVLSTVGKNYGTGGRAEYRQITEENARSLLSLYHMYEFSDRFRLISTVEVCGSLFHFVEAGLLDTEEVWEAMLC